MNGVHSFLPWYYVLNWSENFPHLMECKISWPQSQKTAICPISEPDKRITIASHSITIWSILILSSSLCLGLPSGLFSSFPAPPPKPYMHFSFPPCVQHGALSKVALLSLPKEALPNPNLVQSAHMLCISYESRAVYFRFKLPCTSKPPSIQEAAKVCRMW